MFSCHVRVVDLVNHKLAIRQILHEVVNVKDDMKMANKRRGMSIYIGASRHLFAIFTSSLSFPSSCYFCFVAMKRTITIFLAKLVQNEFPSFEITCDMSFITYRNEKFLWLRIYKFHFNTFFMKDRNILKLFSIS